MKLIYIGSLIVILTIIIFPIFGRYLGENGMILGIASAIGIFLGIILILIDVFRSKSKK